MLQERKPSGGGEVGILCVAQARDELRTDEFARGQVEGHSTPRASPKAGPNLPYHFTQGLPLGTTDVWVRFLLMGPFWALLGTEQHS